MDETVIMPVIKDEPDGPPHVRTTDQTWSRPYLNSVHSTDGIPWGDGALDHQPTPAVDGIPWGDETNEPTNMPPLVANSPNVVLRWLAAVGAGIGAGFDSVEVSTNSHQVYVNVSRVDAFEAWTQATGAHEYASYTDALGLVKRAVADYPSHWVVSIRANLTPSQRATRPAPQINPEFKGTVTP